MDILKTFLTAIEPQLIEACAVVATAFMGWLCATLRTSFKVQIEEKHERALKKAAATGAKSAARLGLEGLKAKIHVEEHILESVPDAVAFHKPKPKTFTNIIEGALDDHERSVQSVVIQNLRDEAKVPLGNVAASALKKRGGVRR